METPANNDLRSSAKHPRSSAFDKARKKKRGVRRPGAGAPSGNFNALKHGRHSMQFAALGAVMASNPRLRDSLLALARRHGLKQAKAEEIGCDVLLRFLKHADDIAAGRTKKRFLPDGFQDLAD